MTDDRVTANVFIALPLFEIAVALMRFDHVASVIATTGSVSVVRADEKLTAFVELEWATRNFSGPDGTGQM